MCNCSTLVKMGGSVVIIFWPPANTGWSQIWINILLNFFLLLGCKNTYFIFGPPIRWNVWNIIWKILGSIQLFKDVPYLFGKSWYNVRNFGHAFIFKQPDQSTKYTVHIILYVIFVAAKIFGVIYHNWMWNEKIDAGCSGVRDFQKCFRIHMII